MSAYTNWIRCSEKMPEICVDYETENFLPKNTAFEFSFFDPIFMAQNLASSFGKNQCTSHCH